MAEEKKKNVRREKKEIIADLDKKIAYHERLIVSLKEKKEAILNPVLTPKAQLKTLLDKANEKGISPEEMAKMLGISL